MMISRVEVEMNMNWAEQNPALFVKSVLKFKEDYAYSDWDVKVEMSRKHYIYLIATRKFTD